MRDGKAFIGPAIRLAALIALLAAVVGMGPAQSPAAVNPVAAVAPNSTAAAAPTAAPAADEDIRDIRPPVHIPYGWLWAAYVAGGLALAGLGLAAWRWLERRDRSRRKLLYELTLEQLEAARALMEPLKGYQFSIAVSDIIRGYIEKRFGARAARRTTEEFLRDLLTESHAALLPHQRLLAEFLEHCDLAKFARWQLSMPQMEAMYDSACTFVIETGKPAAPAAAPSAPAEPQSILLQPGTT